MSTLNELLALAASRYQLFEDSVMRYTELTDIAAGGSIGSAASTVDLYPFIAINQTTANKVLTLATPTNTSIARGQFIANTGTQPFFMYGRMVRPGAAEEFVYVPSVGWRRTHSSTQVIAQSAAGWTAPDNDTNENTLVSLVIPGGVIGANGRLVVNALWSYTNSTNQKTLRVKLGNTSFLQTNRNTAIEYTIRTETVIQNTGSESAQIASVAAISNPYASGTAAVLTGSEDTGSDLTLALTGQKATGAETLKLESYTVELLRFA